jgi:hypothetical protein
LLQGRERFAVPLSREPIDPSVTIRRQHRESLTKRSPARRAATIVIENLGIISQQLQHEADDANGGRLTDLPALRITCEARRTICVLCVHLFSHLR